MGTFLLILALALVLGGGKAVFQFLGFLFTVAVACVAGLSVLLLLAA